MQTEPSKKLRAVYQSHWRAAREFLTFFDTVRFCRFLALVDERTESKCRIKNKRLLVSCRRNRFGNALNNTSRHILNLLDYDLTDIKVSCCRMVSTLSCRPGICAKKKSSLNLSHCGHSFYITVQLLLSNTLLQKLGSPTSHICTATAR